MEAKPIIDPIADHDRIYRAQRKQDSQFHMHPDGQSGGSRCGGCNVREGAKMSGVKLPPLEGVKGETGGMDVGDTWHKVFRAPLYEYYTSDEFKQAHPGIIYGEEIYVTHEFVFKGEKEGEEDRLLMISPVDMCLVTEPGFVKKKVKFRNVEGEVLFKHPDAKWIAVWDVKSADRSLFWKYYKKGASWQYIAQMTFYMKATGVSSIPMIFINKSNMKMFYKIVKYDESNWTKIEAGIKRKIAISKAYRANELDKIIDPTDLTYITDDDEIECKYCNLSTTHEEVVSEAEDADVDNKELKEIRLVLDKPCEHAAKFVRAECLQKFTVGSVWRRGASHIEILSVDNDTISSKNQKGSPFTDTIFHALKSFKVLQEKINPKPSKKKK